MNILFFLIPKSEVSYITDDFTVLQAMELMEQGSHSAIPIIGKNGKYIGTITEGDFLWGIKNGYRMDLSKLERVSIMKLPRKKDNQPVSINADIESLISKATIQNFIPVVDDDDSFIGIITRKDIIQYCYDKMKK